MDNSLQALCHALKKVAWQLKPQINALSFLLLVGRDNQGKSTLIRQSHYEHHVVDAERGADIYFNQHGIVVILGEAWLNQSKNLLQYTLKQLNQCHRALKITGIILCVNINDILLSEPLEFAERSKAHTQILTRFGQSINYHVDIALIFTKLDALAGFCEFFQNEHASDLNKPLGFSLNWVTREGKLYSNYKTQFNQFIEVLGQQVIQKMHPARSSIKRTLIREFPLQLASLDGAIQTLIKDISPRFFTLKAIYFTSAQQGGISLDRLNKKIQNEYALTVQDTFPQSINHRAYFVEGAIETFQMQTKRHPTRIAVPHKWITSSLVGIACLSLIFIVSHHFKSVQILDKTNKELVTYNILRNQQSLDTASSLYHLARASGFLESLSSNSLYLPSLQQLKTQLSLHTKQQLQENFLPSILIELEQTIVDTRQSQTARYKALKIYLMLGDRTKFSQSEILDWFRQNDQKSSSESLQKKLALLKRVLHEPFQPLQINQQIVSDVRNYLNALPANYLFYTLAKSSFPEEHQKLQVDGFDLAFKELPVYLTKAGFQQIIAKLPAISSQLQTENWVLARQDLSNLSAVLEKAYCAEYATWWQNFMRKSKLLHVQDYQQARQLTEALHQGNSINKLVDLIQQQTSPDFGANSSLFNQEVAAKFTDLSLMSHTAVHHLTMNLNELEKFLTTLSTINDQGRTAFNLSKARFEGDTLSNPLSALYAFARQVPEPVATWTKQIADNTWFILINDSRNYINQQWQQTVIRDYQYTIAKRYPFEPTQAQEVNIADFDRFFSNHGVLNTFIDQYLRPFIDMSQAQWQLKEVNNYVLPISSEMINELIRANVITNMFFPNQSESSKIEFVLQKLNLDPIVSNLQLEIGNTKLSDTQDSESQTQFHWPLMNAKLSLNSIEGNHYELSEVGSWAFFKMLQKVNVLVDEQDSSSLQILFEVNGNSGRYLLKTQSQINPFIPGILNGFILNDSIA